MMIARPYGRETTYIGAQSEKRVEDTHANLAYSDDDLDTETSSLSNTA